MAEAAQELQAAGAEQRGLYRKFVNDIQMRPGAGRRLLTAFCWSADDAVPERVTVSPLTERSKSVIASLAWKTGPAFAKSSASTLGLIWIWSTTLTPGGSAPLSEFISAALAESSGKSPLSVMLLPLRLIESGARDNASAPGFFDAVLVVADPAAG